MTVGLDADNGIGITLGLAPFALALAVMLLTTGVAYLIALAGALQEDRDRT
jgi:hypothetical protein